MKAWLILLIQFISTLVYATQINVGSKAFTEGYLLGEIASRNLEALPGVEVIRRFGLGSTGILTQALASGEIDVYADYTGTIAEAILHDGALRDRSELEHRLHQEGFTISRDLGFQNTYGLAVRRVYAEEHQLRSISDLKKVEHELRPAFSPEFINRQDGLKNVARSYGLNFGPRVQAIDHMLGYKTMAESKADLIAVYSTDYEIEALDLVLLEDDKKIFPPYRAVFLAKESFAKRQPLAWASLNSLENTIDEKTIRRLNGQVERDHESVSRVISTYLGNDMPATEMSPWLSEVKRRTAEHLTLVGIAVIISILIGIPLGVISFRFRKTGQIVLVLTSIVQTIPSLALLCLLIPLFGIGRIPALIALYLYSLLPVIQNTLIGFQSISPELLETAKALGLNDLRILISIEFPLASRSILGGVRTAAIIGIGTATLAALIGAGGYGASIVSGLATNDTKLVLTGAIPCALMSLAAFAVFEAMNRLLIPRGLRH